MNIIVKPKRQ